MGRKKITVEQLRDEVNKIMEDYEKHAQSCLNEAATNYGKIAVRELKDSSPVAPKEEVKTPGRYKKGWAYKKEKSRLGVSVTVYNKTDGALTHLLEHGHALRQGGRSPANKHIAPVESEVTHDFFVNVEEKLSK